MDTCPDFDICINQVGQLQKDSRANCNSTGHCTDCTDGVDCAMPNTNGDGMRLSCTDPEAYPAVNGLAAGGYIHCLCDDKTLCRWSSEDFLGNLEECDMCISDTTCPISPWFDYEGELIIARNVFLSDPTFNTLQADLYDNGQPNGMAEVLGRIQTQALRKRQFRAFADYDWTDGHYLVIIYEHELPPDVTIEPYGDYYDPVVTDYGDGDVLVYETFVNNLGMAFKT